MPTLYNPGKKKGIFFIPSGATKSPTPTPSFSNTKSVLFDGIDDYVSLGVPTYLQSKQTVTVSMWVRFTAVGNNDYTTLLNLGTANPRILKLRIVPAGTSRRIEFGVLNSGVRATDVDFSDLVSGTWYHIMGCWNNNLNDGTDGQIYLDGALIFQGNTNTTLPSSITTPTYIANQGLWGAFGGNIDEIAIWDTDQRAEVSSVYNLGTPNDLSLLTTPPTAWYRMGDKIIAFPTIPDQIGSNDGTAYNENEATMIVEDVP